MLPQAPRSLHNCRGISGRQRLWPSLRQFGIRFEKSWRVALIIFTICDLPFSLNAYVVSANKFTSYVNFLTGYSRSSRGSSCGHVRNTVSVNTVTILQHGNLLFVIWISITPSLVAHVGQSFSHQWLRHLTTDICVKLLIKVDNPDARPKHKSTHQLETLDVAVFKTVLQN